MSAPHIRLPGSDSSRAPEWPMLRWGLALNVVWEFAHSPLYADWHREWTYLLWTRLHCTVGDVLILLSAFWLTSIVFQTRHWIGANRGAALLFVLLGVGYTIWSEWYNISISASWGYAPAMPVILGIGLSPVLQWVLLPPLTLWLARPRQPPVRLGGACGARSRNSTAP